MYRSEALAAQERAGAAVEEARDALYWANMALADAIIDTVNATCDHPDTAGPTCAHCGEFYISEDSLQFSDDFRILTSDVEDLQREGFPCLAPWGSEYYYFPHSRSHSA